jgi:3-deoxy-manno-octulosonate cytidylyltransferase (CMP-KDO synthetase)
MTSPNLDNVLVLIPARMASTRLPGQAARRHLRPADDCPGRTEGQGRSSRTGRRGRRRPGGLRRGVASRLRSRHDPQGSSVRFGPNLRGAPEGGPSEGSAKFIVNVQGDLPTIEPETVRAALRPLENETVDIATLTDRNRRRGRQDRAEIVKVIGSPLSETRLRALYFTRATAPYGNGPLYHHIGLYAYRRAALERFVSLGPSALEKRESLEQLRALEAGMRIDVEIVDTVPLGVDTPADLEKARRILSAKSN